MRATKVLLAAAMLVGSLVVAGAAPAGAAAVTIDAKVASTSIELGQSVAVTGKVTPARATPRVVVQRSLGRGVWSDRAAGSVAANGTFSVSIRPSAAGLYALRVRSGGGTVKSKTLYLKVRPGAGQAIRGVSWSGYRHSATAVCGDAGWMPSTLGSPAFGDLTGDRVEEAAMIVLCASGGSAHFMVLAVYRWSGGAARFADRWTPSGLPTEWPPELLSVKVAGGFLDVAGKYVPRGGCHACATVPWARRVVFDGTHLSTYTSD